ncbi:MAG: S-layer homology domain-containing protein [Firmicutes bacterium]|nr:S-layer homology domain-containing protein [Bacillota bacterium]
MKKVLSFALVLAMILGSVSMVFAAATSYPDIKGIDAEEAINVLTGLGVLEGYPDGTFKPEGKVTRAEMVKMICAALALPVTEGTYTTKFTDVKPDAWYSAYVYYAITLGIIEGKSETIFDPMGNVTYDQAITMVMRALGYTEAGLNGVYPAAFVSKAVGLGALKGLTSGSQDATRADMAQLIYNVLPDQIGKTGQDDKWGWNGEDDNMLLRLGAHIAKDKNGKNIEKVIGDGADMLDPDNEDVLVNLHDLVGHKVTYYVNDDDQVVAVYEVLTTELNGKYDATKNTIAGTKLTSEADATDPENTFVNGVVEEFEVKAKVPYTWIVEMKNGKVDNVVSVVDWIANADKKVTADDLKDLADEDEPSLLGYEFALDDDDKLDTKSFVLEGVEKLEDIEKNNVVYVYAAAKQGEKEAKIVKVQVGTKTVTGDVDEVLSSGKPIVDGTTYDLADQKGTYDDPDTDAEEQLLQNDIKKAGMLEFAQAGNKEATLYLDVNGKVYTVTNATNDSAYAILLKYQKAEGATKTIDGSVSKIEVFNAKGEDKVYELDLKKAKKSDPDPVEAFEKAIEADKDAFAGTLVEIKVNDKDKVTEITVVETKDIENARINKKGIVYGLDKEYKFDDKVVIFSYSGAKDADGTQKSDLAKASKWAVVKAEALYGSKDVKLTSIEKNIKKGVLKVAITDGGTSTNDNYVFFTGWSEIANNTYKLKVMENGTATTYKSKTNYDADYDVKNGLDLYTLTLDTNGMITGVEAFEANEKDDTYKVVTEFATDKAMEVKTTSTYVQIENKHYTLADEQAVYLLDADGKLTVKTLSFVDGLRTKKYAGIVLFDTVKGDEEYNIIVVVEDAKYMPAEDTDKK